MGIHDDIVRRKLEHGPDNAKYTHHSIQEVLIQIMADLILRQVKDEIMVQQHFGIICDETKDMSKKEQISLVVRYLHKGSIHEEFLGFTYAERLDAESLCNYILEKLKTGGIDIKNCVGQSYDGASVMSGRLSGVQVRIKEHAECAENVHCYAHRLNLVIVDTCKADRHAADYFAVLQKLYIFVSGSFVHPKWLSLQNDLYPDEKPIELKRLSDTRWSAQISAVRAVISRLSVIVALLQKIGDEERGDRAVEARSILNQMDIKFTFCLEIFNDLLRKMKSTSDSLQRTQLNVSAACDLINNVRHYLQQKRTPDEFKEHFDAAKQLAESNELQTTIAFKSRSRARILPRRFEGDMIVTESIGRTEAPPDLATLLLNDIYYPVIDTALSEVERRFGGANRNIVWHWGSYSRLWPISRVQLHIKVRGAVQVKCQRFSARVETDEAYDGAQNS